MESNSDRQVTITVLDNPEVCFAGQLTGLSGRGARLDLDRRLPPGSLLKIETADTLLLGEVIHSEASEGGFQSDVVLEHALYATRELAALSRRLLGDVSVEIGPKR